MNKARLFLCMLLGMGTLMLVAPSTSNAALSTGIHMHSVQTGIRMHGIHMHSVETGNRMHGTRMHWIKMRGLKVKPDNHNMH